MLGRFNIFDDYVAAIDQTVCFEMPTILGIDELHVLGAPRGVITNLEANTIIELLVDRKKQTILHSLKLLAHPERVRVVVIDLWKPYREAIRQFTL